MSAMAGAWAGSGDCGAGGDGARRLSSGRRSLAGRQAYVALGVTPEGTKDILGLWIETSEGAKFWLRVTAPRAGSSRCRGRHHPGIPGRNHPVADGRIRRNRHAGDWRRKLPSRTIRRPRRLPNNTASREVTSTLTSVRIMVRNRLV